MRSFVLENQSVGSKTLHSRPQKQCEQQSESDGVHTVFFKPRSDTHTVQE